MPGPLPQQNRRRRNAPTIPTTSLPAEGRTGPPPKLPPGAKLGRSGRAWWRWAWATPQAAAWALGHEGVVARRASLEDDLDALAVAAGLDFLDDVLEAATASQLKSAIGRLASMASGRLQIQKEMRELDDRLGLTPKAMAALRWSISADSAATSPPERPAVVVTPDRWQRTGT